MAKSDVKQVETVPVGELVEAISFEQKRLSEIVSQHQKAQEDQQGRVVGLREMLKKRIVSGESLGDAVDDFIFLQTNEINSPARYFFNHFRHLVSDHAEDFVLLDKTYLSRIRFGASLSDKDFAPRHSFCLGLLKKDAFSIDLLRGLIILRLISGAELDECHTKIKKKQEIVFSDQDVYSVLMGGKEAVGTGGTLSFSGPKGRVRSYHDHPSFKLIFGTKKIFATVSKHVLISLAKAMKIEIDRENKKFLTNQLDLL